MEENFYSYKGFGILDKLYLHYLRKIPSHPGSRKLRRYVSKHIFPDGIKTISDYGILMNFKTTEYIDQMVIYRGSYEPLSIKMCSKILEKGGNFIDVGANTGIYTLNLSANSKVRTIAIEPNAEAFLLLIKNLSLNRLENISLINIAVGDNPGIFALENPAVNNLGCFRISVDEKHSPHISHYVSLVTLDEIIRLFVIEKIKLIKIDVEGFEMSVFRSINWESNYCPENIIMEYIPDQIEQIGYNHTECLDFLSDRGYMPFNVKGEPFTLGKTNIPENNLWFRLTY